MTGLPHELIPSLIGLLLITLVVRRNLRSRTLKMDRMLMLPGAILLITAYQFIQDPPRELQTWAILAAAAALGAVVGYHRGKLTRITYDPDTRALTAQASIAGIILILAVFVIRFSLRAWLTTQPGGGHTHLAVLATNALLLSTVGVITAQRVEMYLRCRKLTASGVAAA